MIEEKVEKLIISTIENLNYELYDVIYEKEGKDHYLRIFIDSPKGISLDDCEKVNNAITDMLDDANYIKEQYFLEVSSPGLERLIRKDKHLKQNIGNEIVINLYAPIIKTDGKKTEKQITGTLENYDDKKIIIKVAQEKLEIEKNSISNIKLKYNWE